MLNHNDDYYTELVDNNEDCGVICFKHAVRKCMEDRGAEIVIKTIDINWEYHTPEDCYECAEEKAKAAHHGLTGE